MNRLLALATLLPVTLALCSHPASAGLRGADRAPEHQPAGPATRIPAPSTDRAALPDRVVLPDRAALPDRSMLRGERFLAADVRAGAQAAPVVLFDNTHAETAGNADWTITGAYSEFADTLTHHGFVVRSLDSGALSATTLAGVTVVILPEPNHRLAPGEITALTAFVNAGGGMFAIGDHFGSDRDNDGWDSPRIFNELTPAMGITFGTDKINEAPMAVPAGGGDITHGVKSFGCWAGSSLKLSGNARCELAYGAPGGGRPYIASASVGSGRLVAIGDSSPFDDGTGTPGKHLYKEYSNPQYSIPQLALNVVNWLARRPQEPADIDHP